MGLALKASLLAGIICVHAAMVSGESGRAPHSSHFAPLASTTTSCLRHHHPLLLATSTLRMSGGGGQQQQQRRVAGPAVLGKILDDAEEESSDDRSNGQDINKNGGLIDYEAAYKALMVEAAALRAELRARDGIEEDDKKDESEEGGEASDTAMGEGGEGAGGLEKLADSKGTEWLSEIARDAPLRLEHDERKLLRLLEGALRVSEYVDIVDVLSFRSKHKRCVGLVREVCAILCGLTVASDYAKGQQLIRDKDYKANAEFFQRVFEVGRRHKMMNPDLMRGTYGKLMYMLMDTQAEEVAGLLEFESVVPIQTVGGVLKAAGKEGLLDDPLLLLATADVHPAGKTRRELDQEIKNKERAASHLAGKYKGQGLSEEQVRRCIYSVGDQRSTLRQTADAAQQMLDLLRSLFDVDAPEEGFSLEIRGGRGGARLSHAHTKQYRYVEQTLMLWREILGQLTGLWHLCEKDLLFGKRKYSLSDTGQGLQRVQAAPAVGKAMEKILSRVRSQLGTSWVGSSVIHLGDHNVPNALIFIDKYSQIERILNPILLCHRRLPEVYDSCPRISSYIDEAFGGVDNLRKTMIADFFRHAFDGSGADNFYDAGSCIDGRLTSCWNWCSTVEKKKYFPAMLLTGFVGFDGKFDN